MTQSKLLLAASSACALLALPMQAKTALIDFGNSLGSVTSSGGLTYNAPANLTGDPKSTSAALNSTIGVSTGWSVKVELTGGTAPNAGFSGSNTSVASLPAALSAYDQNATRDNIFFDSADGQITVTLSGLNDSKTYRLLFYGSRSSAGGPQTWHLITGTGTAADVVHNSANNSTVVDWNGIAPVGGTIAFTATIATGVGALNFGEVVEVEPGTALLDFNPISGSPVSSAYNTISMIGGTYPVRDTTGDVAVKNMSGASTGWTINVTESATVTDELGTKPDAGNAGSGASYTGTKPAALDGFEPNALNDNFFFNQGAQPAGQLTVTLTGLDNTKTYDLLFYGSRSNLDGILTWHKTIGTGTADDVTHSSTANSTTVVDWNGIAPVGGTIAFTISVTGTVGALNFGEIIEVGAGSTPYDGWATGGELFTDDDNGDGVDNGLAWILGADGPNVSALDKLPMVSTPTGFLQLNFTRENPNAPAKLYVEYGNDLVGWTTLEIPASTGTIGGANDIEVTVGEGSPDTIQVKIPNSYASGSGKLFARLSATEN